MKSVTIVTADTDELIVSIEETKIGRIRGIADDNFKVIVDSEELAKKKTKKEILKPRT